MDYRARASLVHSARALYALNWMDMAPALVYIKSYMNINVVQLGALVTSFYAGLAVFQLIGGYLSSVVGDKKTSLAGLLFVSIFAILSGISSNYYELIISRFFAGASAALFFSPGVSLLGSIVPANKYAFHISVYSGAFSLGGGIGILGWAILDHYLGYRIPFIIAGTATLVLFSVLLILFRNIDNVRTEKSDLLSSFKKVISSKFIIIISFAGISAMIVETIIGQFLVYYLESLNYSSQLAGSISSFALLIGFAGGVMGGYHFSRTDHKIMTFVSISVIMSVFLILIPFAHSVILILILVGGAGMASVYGLSIVYTFIRNFSRRDLVSLSLSFANTLQLAVAVVLPVTFTLLASRYNYTYAWSIMGILGIVLMPLLLFIRKDLENRPV